MSVFVWGIVGGLLLDALLLWAYWRLIGRACCAPGRMGTES